MKKYLLLVEDEKGLLSLEKRVSLETSGITIPDGCQNHEGFEVRETTIVEEISV